MTKLACRAVGLLLALLLGMAQMAGMAAPSLALQPGDGLPPPPDRDLDTIPYRAPDPAESLARAALPATDLFPASRLTYQSLRDGNWEIYVADADGSNPTRVTSRGASDTQPRFNKGCTRIVFSNNASGNYEIATINADGTDLRRLTQHAAADTQPAWSPDGTRIAFQSTRDGQSEIYLMAADGSSLARLTSHAAYDGYPAWSPDGTRIAFSSNRSGSVAIWVMNADGSNPVRLSNQPSSVYPAWSPDGSRLGYSADEDGDGFLEVWLMDADGSNQRLRHDPGSASVDAWVRSWSPDGRWLAFTRIHFVLYEGTWYWDEAILLAHDTVWGRDPLELAMGGRDWHPGWQPLDALPPVTTPAALPIYSRSWSVPVSWSAWDEGVGPSGVTVFDVQTQADGGAWTDWLVHTPETSARYAGVAGRQVKFRLRGWDAVYNVAGWTPDDAAPGTRLFSFYLSGQVHDVRGLALPGAGVSIDPPPVTRTAVDAQATFQARLARAEATQVLAQAAGYASPPASLGSVTHDLEAGFCLPPLDDGVSNGGFEAGGGSLAGWQTGGTVLPRATTSARHTGQAAALLGPDHDPRLSPAEPMLGEFYDHDLVASPDGTLHALCTGRVVGEDYGVVHYSHRTPGGTWAVPIPVGNDGLYHYNRTPALALSGDGRLHAVWVGEAGIYYNHTRQDGTWASHELIGPGGQGPSLVADGRGGLHVVYTRFVDQVHQTFETVRPPGGTWTQPALLLSGGHTVMMAAGPYDVVHLMWAQEEDDIQRAYYRQWTPENQWGPSEQVSPCGHDGIRALVADADGQIHALWADLWPEHDWSDSLYGVRSLDGAWSTPQAIAGMPYVDMATDGTGTVYAVYSGLYAGVDGTFFTFKQPGRDWSEPVFLDTTRQHRAIAIDPADNPHVVYETIEGDRYRTGLPAPQNVSSTLSQAITIPSGLNHPTLSFFYELRGVLPGHEGGLRVAVDDGVSSTVVLTASAGAGWTHAWTALDAWAGQTVTVTLAADSRAGEPYARLALDEVAVGSWMTPVPTGVTPGHVPAGAAAAITVTGLNFMPGAAIWLGGVPLAEPQWAGEGTLTATVPAAQAAGRQPLWVANSGGARGPAIWLHVGQAAFLPVIVR